MRQILEAAGFELQGEARALKLRVEGFELLREQDVHRQAQALTLSIDHIVAQSDPIRGEHLRLDANNLRFMLQDNNSFRGNRWNERDEKQYMPREDLTRKQEEYGERIEREWPSA